MQSYTNYLYYNYTNNIDHFQEIIDNLIKGRLLPENMNEQLHDKMKEWFGPDWLFVFGYNVCDKNYSKPQIHKSDPIYKFITVSFLENNEDDDTYDLFVEEARAFLINTVVKLFSHDINIKIPRINVNNTLYEAASLLYQDIEFQIKGNSNNTITDTRKTNEQLKYHYNVLKDLIK